VQRHLTNGGKAGTIEAVPDQRMENGKSRTPNRIHKQENLALTPTLQQQRSPKPATHAGGIEKLNGIYPHDVTLAR
jgi:hypothetical protein